MPQKKDRIAEAFDLPPEVAVGAPRLTLTSRHTLTTLNPQGILVCESERICFRTAAGIVEVAGKDLSLAELSSDTLTIRGEIASLLFREEEDHA